VSELDGSNVVLNQRGRVVASVPAFLVYGPNHNNARQKASQLLDAGGTASVASRFAGPLTRTNLGMSP